MTKEIIGSVRIGIINVHFGHPMRKSARRLFFSMRRLPLSGSHICCGGRACSGEDWRALKALVSVSKRVEGLAEKEHGAALYGAAPCTIQGLSGRRKAGTGRTGSKRLERRPPGSRRGSGISAVYSLPSGCSAVVRAAAEEGGLPVCSPETPRKSSSFSARSPEKPLTMAETVIRSFVSVTEMPTRSSS